MGLPGFTAASSLYATVGHYASLSGYGRSIYDVIGEPPRFVSPCDTIGQRCCGPDGAVNTQHCHKGLGCNVATGRCEACGAPGQVCCDGDFTGFSLKSYTGMLLDPNERISTCNTGARCDARFDGLTWLGTRRCGTCGNKLNGSCCAPDTSYGLGRCFTDDRTGVRLACQDPWEGSASICIACGSLNQPVCIDRKKCDADWLVDLNGTCVLCGRVGQPPCDLTGCDDYSAIVDWKHDICIAAGGPAQPCRSDGSCNFEGSYCDSKKICRDCGWGWSKGYPMACCPGGKCVEGKCNTKVNMCLCGYEGQVPCRNGCMPGFVDKWGECVKGAAPPPPPPPPSQWKTCNGEPWGLSTVKRTVFVQNANTKCVAGVTYNANSDQEAVACAKRDYVDAVVNQPVHSYTFGLTSQFGCNPVTLSAPDEDDAQTCAQSQCLNCLVTPGGCF